MSQFRELWRRHGRVFCSFGAIQLMQLLLPLLALPWLARVLGPDAFGFLMYLSLLPPLAALLVDWGFAYSAAREAAWRRGDAQSLSDLLGAALAAKILLAAGAAGLAAAIMPFLPFAAQSPAACALALMAGVARGINPIWMFQGAGFGVARAAALDVGASALGLCLVILIIQEPGQWPLYFLFLASCKGAAHIWLYAGLWRQFKPTLNFRAGIKLIKKSAPLCGSSFSQLFCYNGGQLALGFFLSAPDMGIIAACAKMLRALASLANPFTQTFFPEICILRARSGAAAARLIRWSLLLTAGSGALLAAAAWLAAPLLIKMALGTKYATATPILRTMLLAAPLMACSGALAGQMLTPCGLERKQFYIQAACALLSFPAGAALGRFWGLGGGAWLPFCIEALMLALFSAAAMRHCADTLKRPRN